MRLIRGHDGWWYIGRNGTALIPDALVTDGQLSAEGARQVSVAHLDGAALPDHYGLTVLTTTACNLGCPYCFQNAAPPLSGAGASRGIARSMLGADMIDATVSFALGRMTRLGAPTLRLLLFGGEPLLNPGGCLAMLRSCSERVQTVGSIISNGTLMNGPLAARLEAAGLRRVQITLDGPRAMHDGVRATRAGRGTFDAILANVASAQELTALEITVRIHLTASMLPAIGELLRQVAAIADPRRTRVALAVVLGTGRGHSDSLVPRVAAAEQAIRAYATARELGFRTVRPRDSHCDFCSVEDGKYGAVVNADGALFSCWESAGRPGYAVGTVTSGYDDYPRERWVRCGTSGGEGTALRRFTDAVDAGLLDLVRADRVGGRARRTGEFATRTREDSEEVHGG
jgi:uncharacterized protein